MVDWLQVRAPVIRAVEHGVGESDLLAETDTGPRSFNRIEYPYGQVLPQDSTRTGENEWTHTIYANLYFERGREMDYTDDVLHPVADVIGHVMDALAATECVGTYYPSSIEDYAGELDDTLVLLVSIQFEATTLVDMADT